MEEPKRLTNIPDENNDNDFEGDRTARPLMQTAARPKAMGAEKRLSRTSRLGRGNMKTGYAQSIAPGASQQGGLTRVDMIAAVLRHHPRRTVRELIALLDKEFSWNANESAVTGKLYTCRDKFVTPRPIAQSVAQSPSR